MDTRFDIHFPAGWSVSFDNRNGTAVQGTSLTNAEEVGAIAMVREFEVGDQVEISQIAESMISEMGKHFKKFKLLENTEMQLRTMSARRVKYLSDCPATHDRFQHVDYLIINDARGYLIMTGAPQSEYHKFVQELASIVNSFEFKSAMSANFAIA